MPKTTSGKDRQDLFHSGRQLQRLLWFYYRELNTHAPFVQALCNLLAAIPAPVLKRQFLVPGDVCGAAFARWRGVSYGGYGVTAEPHGTITEMPGTYMWT
jgi:hypothetical protein